MTQVQTLLLALLLLMAAAGCIPAEDTKDDPNPAESNDEAQIYAAAIREIHSIERARDLVYVVTTTEDMAIFDGQTAAAQLLSIDLQEAIAAELAGESFELIWIKEFDDAAFDPANWRETPGWRIADGEGMVITLGNIYPQEDGSVQLSFFMTCADLCGSGKNLVLTEDSNNWHVTDSVGPEIAS
jgi:hypothetical protein